MNLALRLWKIDKKHMNSQIQDGNSKGWIKHKMNKKLKYNKLIK